ncbi:hypothetical protein B0H66DRAFT_32258 [Apodospora peruviana]|uniref:Uncharacterized protein n=1 Tax=Apodospora peruviana TaxID=516989 RepID=A0AAE0IR05_9PEZI|nr:hypothetical protein B0H66DRAFT_32258 [Apodospora peruviana]
MLSSTVLPATAALSLLAGVSLAAPYHMQSRVIVPQTHYEVINARFSMPIDPSAVVDVKCLDPKANIVFHDMTAAILSICGGIAGDITKCQGRPEKTRGQSGSALFKLNAVSTGAKITISKGQWERCQRAARDACPTGSMSGTCVGGATSGNVAFTLTNP